MKKLSVIIIYLTLFWSYVFAINEWATIGTVWYYDINTDTEFGYVKIETIKDTTVFGKECRLLIVKKSVYRIPGVYETFNLDSLITFQDNNKIYLFQKDQFLLLYDFNPSLGDIWNIGLPQSDTIKCPIGKVRVDSIKYISLNSLKLKAIYTSPYNNSSMEFTDVIIEGIGCLGYLLPISTCNPIIDRWGPGGPIRCFNSLNFSYSWSCNECDFITQIKGAKSEQVLLIYPNPFSDEIHIKLKPAISFPVLMTISTISGKVMLMETINNEDFSSSMENYQEGVYLITLIDNNSIIYHQKIIKQ